MATDAIIKTNVKYGSYFWVQWSVREQDAARNKTVILWSCGLHPEEQYYTNAIRMSAVVINGRTVYSGGTYSDITDYREKTFASGTMEIDHESDGSKTFTVSAFSGWLYGNGDYNAPAQSFELPTIPRATVPSMGAATIGEEVTISLPRASGTFTHTLTYSFGSASGTIGSALGTSAVWRLPESLAAQIPHDPDGTGTLTCVTYSGSTLIGSKTIAFTASVPGSMKPALTPGWATVTYDNSGTKASAIRAWVQGYSKARAVFDDSRITCKQGASVRGYSITYLGKTVSESPYRTETIGGTAATVRCTVTDSRGLSAYEDFEIAIHPYAPPAITGARLYRADGDGAASDSGTHIAGRATANYSSIGGENAATIRGYWKAVGGSYGSGEALSSGVTGIISGSAVISADRSYVAKLVITDSLGNTAEFEDSIPTERVAFHLKEGGNGAAFGKAAETEYVLELAEDWELKGGKKAGAGILQTTAATDLNAAAEKIAVLDGDGTVRYRTPAELLADLGADYIVEQGTSNGWAYRKWSSGTAECWLLESKTITGSPGSIIGNAYYISTNLTDFPAIFSETPRGYGSGRLGSGIGWLTCIPRKKETITLFIIGNANSTEAHVDSVMLTGRWK